MTDDSEVARIAELEAENKLLRSALDVAGWSVTIDDEIGLTWQGPNGSFTRFKQSYEEQVIPEAMIAARPTGEEQEPDRIGFYSAGDGE